MARTSRGSLQVAGRPAAWRRQGSLDGRPVLVLAHGAGAALDSPFMESTAQELERRGFCVVRFHFPYMQQRVDDGSRRPPDRAPLLLDTWCAILDRVGKMAGAGPLVMAGKSMGGRVASMVLAAGRAPQVRAAVYLGYPLHPAGQPGKERADHLSEVSVPQLFISGTRDPLANLERLEAVVGGLSRAELLLIPGGDHSFARRKRDERELGPMPDWLGAVAVFVQAHASRV